MATRPSSLRPASARHALSITCPSINPRAQASRREKIKVMSDTERLTLPDLAELARQGRRIAMVTAYDASSARLADAAGLDIVLVGDSAATTILGHDSTLPVTMDEMLLLTRAVTRVVRRAFV